MKRGAIILWLHRHPLVLFDVKVVWLLMMLWGLSVVLPVLVAWIRAGGIIWWSPSRSTILQIFT